MKCLLWRLQGVFVHIHFGKFLHLFKIVMHSLSLFSVVSSPPKEVRAVAVTSSQIKIAWYPPERVYGVLNGYKVRVSGMPLYLALTMNLTRYHIQLCQYLSSYISESRL